MNLGVGKVSKAARKAIEEAGGSVEPAANPELLLVQLPDKVAKTRSVKSDGSYSIIDLPDVALRFTRAWETKDMRIDTEEEASDLFAKGKEAGRVMASAFPECRGHAMAMAERFADDFIVDERGRRRYTDGFVAGYYEVSPIEPTGISI